jgi:hypothetical protein
MTNVPQRYVPRNLSVKDKKTEKTIIKISESI